MGGRGEAGVQGRGRGAKVEADLGISSSAPRAGFRGWTGPTTFVGLGDPLKAMTGAAALARAKQRREAAIAAQEERVEAEQAAIKLNPSKLS